MDGEIDPDELAALIDDEDCDRPDDGAPRDGLRIVDIRDRRVFDRGHLPGSESIPFPELSTRVAELAGADRIVTVCPHGVASKQAARLIGSYAGTVDARVESLRGGVERWERLIGRLETTADDPSVADADGGPDEGPEAPF